MGEPTTLNLEGFVFSTFGTKFNHSFDKLLRYVLCSLIINLKKILSRLLSTCLTLFIFSYHIGILAPSVTYHCFVLPSSFTRFSSSSLLHMSPTILIYSIYFLFTMSTPLLSHTLRRRSHHTTRPCVIFPSPPLPSHLPLHTCS